MFKYKTVVVSDLHLGIKSSKAKEVVRFLKAHPAETIILNGDIIDGWQLKKSGEWKKKHSRFFKLILKFISDKNIKIVYLRGNHDDFLDEIMPFTLGNFSIQREFYLQSGGKKYYVIHGDIFDTITTKMTWLAKIGDVGYTFLLWLNRHYNHYRVKKGLPYYSISQMIKNKVKKAVNFITDFEEQLSDIAKNKGCDGIITGHIHQPANKMIDGIHYLNSGDWVESMTGLVENFDNTREVIEYANWDLENQAQKDTLKIKSNYTPSIDLGDFTPQPDYTIPKVAL